MVPLVKNQQQRNLILNSRRHRFETTHLQLNTQVVLALRDRSLIDYTKIPAAKDLPRAAGRRVRKHIVFLEGLGHAAMDEHG